MYSRNAIALALLTGVAAAGQARAQEPVSFKVSIESVTTRTTLALPDGSRIAAPISPGLYVVSPKRDALFQPGRRAGAGLERLAEDGNPEELIAELNEQPSGAAAKSFLHDQDFVISAVPGDRLHFAVMFAQSNDLFYAPALGGIDLFPADGRPVSADVTGQLALWDAGTERHEQPGIGPNQAPRQAAPNTGLVENGVVGAVSDHFRYPPVRDVIRVRITPDTTLPATK